MLLLYRLLFWPALLLALPYYAYRMIRRGGYRHDFHHRFGLIDRPPPKPSGITRIWIQAVSVGEVKAIGPLLHILAKDSKVEVVLTTTTSTGYALARKLYAHDVQKTGVFPLDFVTFSRNAWRRIDPDLAVLMEGELWPEHLAQAAKRSIPIVLINARLSDRSFRRYGKFPRTAAWLMGRLQAIYAASVADAERFQSLSGHPERVSALGNLKFDVEIEPMLSQREREVLRKDLGLESGMKHTRSPMRPPLILLGASTWPGEEAMLLEVLEEALENGVNIRLLIIPRHAERRGEIVALLQKQSRKWHLRSQGSTPPQPVRIYVGDTTGELALLSQVADLAYIGKSLPPHDGGQTPIEAGALGLPMVYGPRMSNFRQVCASLERSGAAIRVENKSEAKYRLLDLLSNYKTRERMMAAARQWHRDNQGATERTVTELGRFIKTTSHDVSALRNIGSKR